MEMEDPRCTIVAVETVDPRCGSLHRAVNIKHEGPRWKNLEDRNLHMTDDPRCDRMALKMEDPRCANLFASW
jgi:hypothetical protein